MFKRFLPRRWRDNVWLLRLLDWGVLFVMLFAAILLATQRRETPQLILLALLYIITINFSLPDVQGTIGLVPVVSVTSLLIMDLATAVPLAVTSIILAELARPLWQPVWQNIDARRPNFRERFSTAVTYLLALIAAGFVYQESGGQRPPTATGSGDLVSFFGLALTYSLVYILLALTFWLLRKRPLRQFFQDHLFALLGVSLLAQPFALFGAIVFTLGGLPIFVIFCLSIMFVSVLLWLSWQRSYIMQQRLTQFAILNSVGASLRETLELPEVLARTLRTVAELIPADAFLISLVDENDAWQQPAIDNNNTARIIPHEPDDLTRWVAQKERVLELTSQNMHFAEQHYILIPDPKPAAWLGVPLRTVERPIGVLAVVRYPPQDAFSRWSREVLLAVAGQASAAIQNARLYSETLRLYNLTDEALAQRLKQLQALLNTMQEGVLMVDPNGRIVLVNTFAAQLLNQPAAELRGQKLNPANAAAAIGYDPVELSSLLALLQIGQTPQSLRLTFQIQLPNSAKPLQYMERSEAPVVAKEGQIIGWLMLFRDVTEEFELAERRTDLTRMIVHDLRNPVTTFISNMYLVDALLPQNDHENNEAIRAAVGDARQSSYDMLDMVDSLMDINRMETDQFTIEVDAVNLGRLLQKVMQRLQVMAGQRQISLTTEMTEDTPPVWADEDIIRRVLINLIDNALKFTPTGGQVHCRIRSEPPLTPGYDAGARCIIQDNGPGIDPEDKVKIFDRFIRTNRSGAQVRGTGLGLTFCKLAVAAHNGRIWVEDAPEGGSQFIFTLPGVPILPD